MASGLFRPVPRTPRLWAGAEIATHQDLSGLFVVRLSELYLRKGGRFGLVFLIGCFHALGDSRKPQCLSQAADCARCRPPFRNGLIALRSATPADQAL
jgi:hypothetical protein